MRSRPVNSARRRSANEPNAANRPTWGSENAAWAMAKTDGMTTAELARQTNGGHEQILSILKELEQAGKAGQVKLVGFDLDPVSYQMVKDGKIDALVVQDPFKMGYEGMNIVLTKLQGGEVQPFMGLGTKLLTKDNAAEFANDPQVTGK